jgi:acetylornithine/succinyldiaminopimelate/putrescine aminotransferase
MTKVFEVKGEVQKHTGKAGWLFVYIEKEISAEIFRLTKGVKKVGFGFIPVQAKLGRSTWDTAIFPSKDHRYLIAIKRSIGRVENTKEGDLIDVQLTLLQG